MGAPNVSGAPKKHALCNVLPIRRAAQLGRKGGMGNRHVYENDNKDVIAPQGASDVKNLLAEVMAEIRAGKMAPKLGTTLGYL